MSKFVSVVLKKCSVGAGQYAVVTLRSDPVNALNLPVWSQLLSTLTSLESDPSVRGLIITSGLQRDIFTAGNDLTELYTPKTTFERYREFWLAQTTFLARLYRSRLATVAAIRGHSPAGGCGVALCCDERVWTSDCPGMMGLNEVAIGIMVPKYWAQLFVKTIGGTGRAEALLFGGKMVTPDEALKLGLVHELAPKDALQARAEERMQALLKNPDQGRILTKTLLREEFSKAWEAYGEEEARSGWQALSSPGMVKAIGATLQRLSSKPAKL